MIEPEVHFAPAARRELRKLSRQVQKNVVRAIEGLQSCPRPPGVEKIQGRPDFLRIAVKSHRVIYTIHNSRLIIILVIRDRKDAYRGIDNLEQKLTAAVHELTETEVGARLLAG